MVFGNHYLKWADIGFAIELVSYMVIKKNVLARAVFFYRITQKIFTPHMPEMLYSLNRVENMLQIIHTMLISFE